MNKSFLEYLNQRGFYNQCTNYENFDLSLKKPLVGYAGFDCTADSLHVGSLVQIMLLRAFQKFGHKSAFVKNLQVQGTCSNDDPAFNTNQSLLDCF